MESTLHSNYKTNRLGDVCHKGKGMMNGGHTETPSKHLFYCNKRKMHCHCGNCDGNCGPTNGCPCFDCLELVGMRVLPKRFSIRICKRASACACEICRDSALQVKNSNGNIAVKGNFGGSGGHTKVDSGKLYYCGLVHNECKCGSCDGRCGPTNGCPCSSCLTLFLEGSSSRKKLTSNELMPKDNSSASAPPSTSSSDESQCVICLNSEKTTLLVPCGHYAFCDLCADGIVECAMCRARIEKRVKVFES